MSSKSSGDPPPGGTATKATADPPPPAVSNDNDNMISVADPPPAGGATSTTTTTSATTSAGTSSPPATCHSPSGDSTSTVGSKYATPPERPSGGASSLVGSSSSSGSSSGGRNGSGRKKPSFLTSKFNYAKSFFVSPLPKPKKAKKRSPRAAKHTPLAVKPSGPPMALKQSANHDDSGSQGSGSQGDDEMSTPDKKKPPATNTSNQNSVATPLQNIHGRTSPNHNFSTAIGSSTSVAQAALKSNDKTSTVESPMARGAPNQSSNVQVDARSSDSPPPLYNCLTGTSSDSSTSSAQPAQKSNDKMSTGDPDNQNSDDTPTLFNTFTGSNSESTAGSVRKQAPAAGDVHPEQRGVPESDPLDGSATPQPSSQKYVLVKGTAVPVACQEKFLANATPKRDDHSGAYTLADYEAMDSLLSVTKNSGCRSQAAKDTWTTLAGAGHNLPSLDTIRKEITRDPTVKTPTLENTGFRHANIEMITLTKFHQVAVSLLPDDGSNMSMKKWKKAMGEQPYYCNRALLDYAVDVPVVGPTVETVSSSPPQSPHRRPAMPTTGGRRRPLALKNGGNGDDQMDADQSSASAGILTLPSDINLTSDQWFQLQMKFMDNQASKEVAKSQENAAKSQAEAAKSQTETAKNAPRGLQSLDMSLSLSNNNYYRQNSDPGNSNQATNQPAQQEIVEQINQNFHSLKKGQDILNQKMDKNNAGQNEIRQKVDKSNTGIEHLTKSTRKAPRPAQEDDDDEDECGPHLPTALLGAFDGKGDHPFTPPSAKAGTASGNQKPSAQNAKTKSPDSSDKQCCQGCGHFVDQEDGSFHACGFICNSCDGQEDSVGDDGHDVELPQDHGSNKQAKKEASVTKSASKAKPTVASADISAASLASKAKPTVASAAISAASLASKAKPTAASASKSIDQSKASGEAVPDAKKTVATAAPSNAGNGDNDGPQCYTHVDDRFTANPSGMIPYQFEQELLDFKSSGGHLKIRVDSLGFAQDETFLPVVGLELNDSQVDFSDASAHQQTASLQAVGFRVTLEVPAQLAGQQLVPRQVVVDCPAWISEGRDVLLQGVLQQFIVVTEDSYSFPQVAPPHKFKALIHESIMTCDDDELESFAKKNLRNSVAFLAGGDQLLVMSDKEDDDVYEQFFGMDGESSMHITISTVAPLLGYQHSFPFQVSTELVDEPVGFALLCKYAEGCMESYSLVAGALVSLPKVKSVFMAGYDEAVVPLPLLPPALKSIVAGLEKSIGAGLEEFELQFEKLSISISQQTALNKSKCLLLFDRCDFGGGQAAGINLLKNSQNKLHLKFKGTCPPIKAFLSAMTSEVDSISLLCLQAINFENDKELVLLVKSAKVRLGQVHWDPATTTGIKTGLVLQNVTCKGEEISAVEYSKLSQNVAEEEARSGELERRQDNLLSQQAAFVGQKATFLPKKSQQSTSSTEAKSAPVLAEKQGNADVIPPKSIKHADVVPPKSIKHFGQEQHSTSSAEKASEDTMPTGKTMDKVDEKRQSASEKPTKSPVGKATERSLETKASATHAMDKVDEKQQSASEKPTKSPVGTQTSDASKAKEPSLETKASATDVAAAAPKPAAVKQQSIASGGNTNEENDSGAANGGEQQTHGRLGNLSPSDFWEGRVVYLDGKTEVYVDRIVTTTHNPPRHNVWYRFPNEGPGKAKYFKGHKKFSLHPTE